VKNDESINCIIETGSQRNFSKKILSTISVDSLGINY